MGFSLDQMDEYLAFCNAVDQGFPLANLVETATEDSRRRTENKVNEVVLKLKEMIAEDKKEKERLFKIARKLKPDAAIAHSGQVHQALSMLETSADKHTMQIASGKETITQLGIQNKELSDRVQKLRQAVVDKKNSKSEMDEQILEVGSRVNQLISRAI